MCRGGFHRLCLGVGHQQAATGVVAMCAKCGQAGLTGRDVGRRARQAVALEAAKLDHGGQLISKLSVFLRFCEEQLGMARSEVLPVEAGATIPVIAIRQFLAYRVHETSIKKGTLDNDVWALRAWHRDKDIEDRYNPMLRSVVTFVLVGARKHLDGEGRGNQVRKTPVDAAMLRAGLRGARRAGRAGQVGAFEALRDQVVLLLGFFGLLRGTEVANLRVGDVTASAGAVDLWLRRTKVTGDVGVPVNLPGRTASSRVDIAGPVMALLALHKAQGSGPDDVLLPTVRYPGSARSRPTGSAMGTAGVALVVRDCMERGAGVDAGAFGGARNFAAHSLRRGGATHAAKGGGRDHELKLLGRWKSESYQVYLELDAADRRTLAGRL